MDSEENFGFGFNNFKFSDRLLRIEIMGWPSDSSSDSEECRSNTDKTRPTKRRRKDIHKKSGDEDEDTTNVPRWGIEGFKVIRVKKFHINSLILAAKSPFFYKLFTNGMKESRQKDVTLRINASEEAAFMELLKFMYSNTVSVDTARALLDVLMVADKFEVASCMSFCCKLLHNLPMTREFALLYLQLPSTVVKSKFVQPITDAAKQLLASRYKDITKYREEVMSLPLCGIEVVLSSDNLQIASEDDVYDFILKWARVHYPLLKERKEILGSRLASFIRFPFLICQKLGTMLTCPDFEPKIASKLVQEALLLKAEAPNRQATVKHRHIERNYIYKPIKVVEFELPRLQCVVYMDLKREECAGLFPSGRVATQPFCLNSQRFYVSARCNMDNNNSFNCFGMFLGVNEILASFCVDFALFARSNRSQEFKTKFKSPLTFTKPKAFGCRNLFQIPWMSFIGDNSDYFINGILHLKAEITMTDPPRQCN